MFHPEKVKFKHMLKQRAERLDHFVNSDSKVASYPLLKLIEIAPAHIESIKQAVNIVLWECLKEYYKDYHFNFIPNIFDEHVDLIKKLPNITPNGLLLPKNENILAYNIFHKTCVEVFSKYNFFKKIKSIQFPINIRIVIGNRDIELEKRPRASTKIHTDIWASEPSAALMGFLSLFGDTQNISVKFMEPDFIPEDMIRPLDDYDQAKHIVKNSKLYGNSLDESGFFIVDPYLFHQTFMNSNAARLSLDMRFLPCQFVDSDFFDGEERKKYFLKCEEWSAIGKTKIFYTDEPFKEFLDTSKSTSGYAVNFQLIDPGEKLWNT